MTIEINNLVKRYGDFVAVNHLNLSIQEGEIFGLLGPNGSGKSTTINCILSILKYDKGNIRLFGKEMNSTAYDIKKDIGVVMQSVAIYQELTVYENIDYFCGLYIKDKAKRKGLVEDTIEFCGLENFRKHYPKQLSGGLLRRLNIACGIAHKPKLILMDEPTVAVDPQSRNNILEGIRRLNKEGATILYTSHYMEEVEQICSRIAIMDKGNIIATGTKEELKSMINAGEKIRFEIYEFDISHIDQIKAFPNVQKVYYKNHMLTVQSTNGTCILAQLIHYMEENRIPFEHVYFERPTLNDVFLEMTGKELRDNV